MCTFAKNKPRQGNRKQAFFPPAHIALDTKLTTPNISAGQCPCDGKSGRTFHK